MLKLTFWMNMPSFYQADLFRALLRTGKVDLRVIFTGRVSEDRSKLGWKDDLNGYEFEFLDEHNQVLHAVNKVRRYYADTNIVGGLWAGKVTESVLVTLLALRSRYFIYSEAPDPRISLPIFKRRLLKIIGGPLVRHAAGLLPISHFATAHFESYGAEDAKVYPFGYFRSPQEVVEDNSHSAGREGTEILYVGQIVHRKGIDVLLSALEPLFAAEENLRLQLVGSGEMEGELMSWVRERNLSSKVLFQGPVNPRKIMSEISQADLLVLPSRWDGWGIVVNEALMAGVPVIVSDMCGAADVVKEGINGYVFKSDDAEELERKLSLFLNNKTSWSKMREASKDVGRRLDAANAANYLVEVLESGMHNEADLFINYPWITA